MRKRDKAPPGTYWRGPVLWARAKVRGVEHRWSLRTGDAAVALRRLSARRDELAAAAHFGEARRRYEEAFVEWSRHIVTQVGAATAQRYAVSLRQLEGFLRPLYIDQVDREVVGAIVRARRAAGVSTATVRRDLSALSSVLGHAIDEGWREGNPALERLGRLRERRDPIVLPDRRDIARVTARAPGQFKGLIQAALLTGCRQDELVTAERRRLDHRLRQLTVIGKGNRLRVVQLTDEAYALLRALPASLSGPWLFWHGDGEPYRNVASRFALFVATVARAAAREGAEFRPFRFHDLRHLYAVEYLRHGVGSIYDLQQQLGHTSVKTTELYLRFLTAEEARESTSAKGRA